MAAVQSLCFSSVSSALGKVSIGNAPPRVTGRVAQCSKSVRRSCTAKLSVEETDAVHRDRLEEMKPSETRLMSIAALPIVTLAAAGGLESALQPVGDLIRSLNLPDWLVHWGHPGNMAVVLFAMGGYGSYLGWQIRLSDNSTLVATAKELHPKLLGGMSFFFALGATGGIISLVTVGKPILESPHSVTGLTGLGLLLIQSILSSQFKGKPELRTAHAYLGSSIMALFLTHAALGLKFGLSF